MPTNVYALSFHTCKSHRKQFYKISVCAIEWQSINLVRFGTKCLSLPKTTQMASNLSCPVNVTYLAFL